MIFNLITIKMIIPIYIQAFVDNCDLVWKQSVWSSVIASSVSSKHLKEEGMLVMTGAKAALNGTPGEWQLNQHIFTAAMKNI